MVYNLFLDETGDHGLNFIDKNFPLFLLCGCIIDSKSLEDVSAMINDFKKKFFNTSGVILHSRDIRKCEGAFQILFDLSLKEKFYSDLNEILGNADYLLIGSAVQKEKHIEMYGKGARNPYALSLSFIIERLIFYLDNKPSDSKAEIFVEERGKKEDKELLDHYNLIIDRGTYYVAPDRLKRKIIGLKFHNKRENIIGLQLADLCAYPMARYILNPKEPYIPFKVIENKIYCSEQGKYWGWGLKLFP